MRYYKAKKWNTTSSTLNMDESENVMLSNKRKLKQGSCLYKSQEQAKLICGEIPKWLPLGCEWGGEKHEAN